MATNSITVELEGKFKQKYEGPAGKSLKEMFPSLNFEKVQVRVSPGNAGAGRMVATNTALLSTAKLSTVDRASLG